MAAYPGEIQTAPTIEDFGSPEEIENFIQRAMAQTGMSREQLTQLGQQGMDFQSRKAASDPNAGSVAGQGEIRRMMQSMNSKMDQNDIERGVQSPLAGPQVGPGAAAQPVTQFAGRESAAPTHPPVAAALRAQRSEVEGLRKELDEERLNNIRNAGEDAYSEGQQMGERMAIESGRDRIQGSPENRERLSMAQNRRALAMGDLQKRLSRLNKNRRG